MSIRYPNIQVELTGCNGNALSIVATASKVMKRKGVTVEEIAEYRKQSFAGDYDNLIQTAQEWVDVV